MIQKIELLKEYNSMNVTDLGYHVSKKIVQNHLSIIRFLNLEGYQE